MEITNKRIFQHNKKLRKRNISLHKEFDSIALEIDQKQKICHRMQKNKVIFYFLLVDSPGGRSFFRTII